MTDKEYFILEFIKETMDPDELVDILEIDIDTLVDLLEEYILTSNKLDYLKEEEND